MRSSARHNITAEEPSYTPSSTTRRAPLHSLASVRASAAECIVRGGISPSASAAARSAGASRTRSGTALGSTGERHGGGDDTRPREP